MATRMQQRRGTAAQWTSTNSGNGPILAAGEIGFESDTNKFKVGDGVNHWVDLTYFTDAQSAIDALTDLVDGAPDLLNTLGEIAAALGDDPTFFTTVATNLENHELDTTNVHGIEDTSLLATTSYVDEAVGGVTTDITQMAGTGLDYNLVTDQFDIDDTVATKSFAAGLLTGATKSNITITGDENGLTISAENGVADSTTSDLAEGTNLYFTDERAQDAVGNSVGTGLSYNDSTGAISVDTTAIQAKVSGVTDTEIGYLDGVTSAVQTQLNDKAPIASPTFTGTVSGITASMVGLGNVDNTSDADKPVSTATQSALDLKAPLANPTFTGTVSGVTKAHVGLGDVDNTSDASKPVSTATQTALDAKLALAGGTMTGDIVLVGLPTQALHPATKAYVDNAIEGLVWKTQVNLFANSDVNMTGSTGTLMFPVGVDFVREPFGVVGLVWPVVKLYKKLLETKTLISILERTALTKWFKPSP